MPLDLALMAMCRAVSPFKSAAAILAFFSRSISTTIAFLCRTALSSGVSPSTVLASKSGFAVRRSLMMAVWFLSMAQCRQVLLSLPLMSASAYFLIKASTMDLWPPLPEKIRPHQSSVKCSRSLVTGDEGLYLLPGMDCLYFQQTNVRFLTCYTGGPTVYTEPSTPVKLKNSKIKALRDFKSLSLVHASKNTDC